MGKLSEPFCAVDLVDRLSVKLAELGGCCRSGGQAVSQAS